MTQISPIPAALPEGVVEVWPVWLQTSLRSDLRSLLSRDEIERADRFATEGLRRGYEGGRGILRLLLASYTHLDPRQLAIAMGPRGKPELPKSPLRFNVSHSCGLAVFAFTVDREIGVDIEQRRSLPDLEVVARHGLTSREVTQLLTLADQRDRESYFFRCWTRREARAKAAGVGIAAPAPSDDFAIDELEPAPDFICALAQGKPARPVKVYPLTGAQQLIAGFRRSRSDFEL